jgi:predicted protein tyrosine phosphatase
MNARYPTTVHVCALRHIPEILERTGARHLVSAINADLAPSTPASLTATNHLKLDMHDIIEAQAGSVAPAEEHVSELLDFVHRWDRRAPLLIHCFAGLSRSTAAAFITLCALNPELPEAGIAAALRRASDTAVPNRRFVTLADRMLDRQGRMVAAIDTMSPHRPALECVPFGVHALQTGANTSQAA